MLKPKCNHQKQTLTNVYGDCINRLKCRSISQCIKCGKKFYENTIDKNCKRANEFSLKSYILSGDSIGDVSDGYHTFNELYHQREILFSIVCNTYVDYAWKSWLHNDGTMYENSFIAGITTSAGDYTFHLRKELWEMFHIKELERAPKWDGHKPDDVTRLCRLLELEPYRTTTMDNNEKLLALQVILMDTRANNKRYIDKNIKAAKILANELQKEKAYEKDMTIMLDRISQFENNFDLNKLDNKYFRLPYPKGYEDMEKIHNLKKTYEDKSRDFKCFINHSLEFPERIFRDWLY